MNRIFRAGSPVRRVLCLFLALVLTVNLIAFTALTVQAYDAKTGVVNTETSPLNVRSGPGTNNASIGSLAPKTQVTIVDEAEDSSGMVWYKIEYNQGYGYVRSDYINLVVVVEPEDDPEFEAYLEEQGFPESYRGALRQLHALYPNWVFKPQQTGLNWVDAVNAQAVTGKSLVEGSVKSSWKMVSDAAYDWETSSWYRFDGSWVAASREIIAYYMDPRNFLNSTSVFQFLDQRLDTNVQTVDGVKQIIAGSFMESDVEDTDETTLNYAEAIYNAGVTYGVNPYVLASMILIEMGYSGSAQCSGTYDGVYVKSNEDGTTEEIEDFYKGYFNFYSIGAYSSGSLSAIEMGLIYAMGGLAQSGTSYGRPWTTRLKAINGGADFYATEYLAPGQCTLYLKRYNVQGEKPYTHQYATSVYSAKVEGDKLAKGYSEAMRETALTFYIPVYENMPETAAELPTGDGSPNMKLASLDVLGYSLTPAFDKDTLEYTLVVAPEVQSVVIDAVTLNSAATVAGTGEVTLADGLNDFDVVVTAENGDVRTYTITIAREAGGQTGDGPGGEEEEPDLTGVVVFTGKSTPDENNNFLFAPGVLTTDFTEQLLEIGKVIALKSDGTAKDEGSVLATGDQICVYDMLDNEYGIYTVVVKGDVDGDGKITIVDMVKIRNHLLEKSLLIGANLLAADANQDGKYIINDIIVLRNHMLGRTPIG